MSDFASVKLRLTSVVLRCASLSTDLATMLPMTFYNSMRTIVTARKIATGIPFSDMALCKRFLLGYEN